jgi:organic radical activating enzyme
MKTPSNSWCILPWVHLFACEQGFLRPCCMALEDKDMINRDAKGDPYLVHDADGVKEGWNSDFMRNIRKQMLLGERPSACRRCFRDEDLGIRSYRQMSNELFEPYIDEAVAENSDDGFSSLDLIRSIDLRLGNLCNLRCRMCSPVSSKAMLNEWAHLLSISTTHPQLEHLQKLDWFSREDFWQIFEKYAKHIERLHFAGGEPLLINQMFDFLERIIETGQASKITLSYITNLTVLPKRIFDLWPKFKRVSLTTSIDGYGAVNSFIRYPSNWETLDKNLKKIDSQAEYLNCSDGLTFNLTVQAYNILRLDEFLEYAATSFQHFGRPKLSLLYYPEHFSIRILPAELKELAVSRLKSFTKRFADKWPSRWSGKQLDDLLSTIDGVINYMMETDCSDLLPEFRRWTDHMDATRGQNLLTIVPEFSPFF